MKFLQKLGKALMLPVACLPICGILMGIGYALCPATMQGGDITGIGNQIGFFLVKAGGALIDNMALLFVIGVGVGMASCIYSIDHSWSVYCQDGSCWSWYLCILKPSVDPNRITSCIEQCILV